MPITNDSYLPINRLSSPLLHLGPIILIIILLCLLTKIHTHTFLKITDLSDRVSFLLCVFCYFVNLFINTENHLFIHSTNTTPLRMPLLWPGDERGERYLQKNCCVVWHRKRLLFIPVDSGEGRCRNGDVRLPHAEQIVWSCGEWEGRRRVQRNGGVAGMPGGAGTPGEGGQRRGSKAGLRSKMGSWFMLTRLHFILKMTRRHWRVSVVWCGQI